MFVGAGDFYGVLRPLPGPPTSERKDIVSLNQQVECVDVVRSPGGEFWVGKGVA